LKKGKPVGFDGMPAKGLSAPAIVKFLHVMVDKCFVAGIVPD
jgi:hypothetical protein